MTPDDVHVEALGKSGVRIVVPDPDSDSLAIIEVRGAYGMLSARIGLRGNYSAFWRPMRWMATSMAASRVSSAALARRKAAARLRMEHGVRAPLWTLRVLRGEEER